MPLRVAICDDALTFPALARSWLQQDGEIEIVAVCTTAAALLAQVEEDQPDVVLLDIVLPDSEAPAETIAALRRLAPSCGVVLCSGMSPAHVEQAGIEAGADGWTSKALTPEQLRAAVWRAARR